MINRICGLNDTYILHPNQSPKKGKFGGITIGVRESDKLPVSIKTAVLIDTPDHVEKLQILRQLHHPTLAETIEIIHQPEKIHIVRPYYEGTDLKTILKKRTLYKNIDPSFWVKAFICLLDGIEHMHQNGLIHRDIKPSNILIRHQPKANPKQWKPQDICLIDFEQSSIQKPTTPNRSPFSLIYSSPEQLLNRQELLSPASDLFSLAITLYEMMAHKPPYQDCNAEILLNLQLTYAIKRPSKINDDLFRIIAKAAHKEPFPLPPRRLAHEVIQEILKKGIESRYQSATELNADLKHYLSNQKPTEKIGFFQRLFSKR